MNIDFAADLPSNGGWWGKENPVEEKEIDFSADLQTYAFPITVPEEVVPVPEAIDPSDPSEEARQDAVLSSLTNAAYSGGIKRNVSKKSRRANNPFFYHRTSSFSEEVVQQKMAIEPQKAAMEHIDAEVENRLKTYEKELSSALVKNIEAVREFFLTELDPLSLGIQGGTAQVHSVMTRIFPDGIDTEQFSQFVHMAKLARKIKMANFLAKYMGIGEDDANKLAESLAPKSQVLVVGPNAEERISQQSTEAVEKRPRTRDRIRMAAERERVGGSDISARAPRGG